MILVSACLLGTNCKYDGGNNKNEDLIEYLKDKVVIPICPEKDGNLTTPRAASEIVGGNGLDVLGGLAKVISKEGKDVTKEFVNGANIALELAKSNACSVAILKERSPSCGCNKIYDGSFSKNLISGMGVTAALLSREGIIVMSEENYNLEA